MQKENEKNGGHRNESREFLFGMLYGTIYIICGITQARLLSKERK